MISSRCWLVLVDNIMISAHAFVNPLLWTMVYGKILYATPIIRCLFLGVFFFLALNACSVLFRSLGSRCLNFQHTCLYTAYWMIINCVYFVRLNWIFKWTDDETRRIVSWWSPENLEMRQYFLMISFNNIFFGINVPRRAFSWFVRNRKVPAGSSSADGWKNGAHPFGDFHLPSAVTSHFVV